VAGLLANLVAILRVSLLITLLALAGRGDGLFTLAGWLAALPGAVWHVPVAPDRAQLAALLAAMRPLPWRVCLLGLPRLPPTLLMLAHHGSQTSSTPEVLAAVAPQQAFAHACYRNRFGHPAPAVLA
jgi:hypothetical protein